MSLEIMMEFLIFWGKLWEGMVVSIVCLLSSVGFLIQSVLFHDQYFF